jgi:indolepyruvate ferredoxin oxidoreductase
MRRLRGTALDIFGRTEERRTERRLIAEYEAAIAGLLPRLEAGNLPQAVEIASIPEQIRGFGHVKERHLKAALARQSELLSGFGSPAKAQAVAA